MRVIKSMEGRYLEPSLDLVDSVFTDHESAEEGKLVRSLVEEIRASRFYVPQLEFIMIDESDAVIGYINFSRFHLDGKYERQCFKKNGRTMTVKDFLEEYSEGTYLVTMRGHITCVKNGVLYDTWDCRDRIIWCAWKVE